jgi:ABC-type uncharacterized transport system permease subunit
LERFTVKVGTNAVSSGAQRIGVTRGIGVTALLGLVLVALLFQRVEMANIVSGIAVNMRVSCMKEMIARPCSVSLP